MDSSKASKIRSTKLFYSAGEEASAAKHCDETQQTLSPSYRLAYTDEDFLVSDELRPVRLQLELLKPEMLLSEAGIDSTLVIFGSARVHDQEHAQAALEMAKAEALQSPDDPDLQRKIKIAENLLDKSHYYEEARRLAKLVVESGQGETLHPLVVATGGGPGIMEAANRGAQEAGGRSIGFNIVLPFEQAPNHYSTPELTFQFHYFAIRKMHFLMRAKALVACPGGFGTLDELFETLTLIQTQKIKAMPILLLGSDFWNRIINFEALIDEGMISEKDLDLFHFVDNAEQAWKEILSFYQNGTE